MLVKDAWYIKSEFHGDLAKEHCHIKLVNPLIHLAIKTLSFLCLVVPNCLENDNFESKFI